MRLNLWRNILLDFASLDCRWDSNQELAHALTRYTSAGDNDNLDYENSHDGGWQAGIALCALQQVPVVSRRLVSTSTWAAHADCDYLLIFLQSCGYSDLSTVVLVKGEALICASIIDENKMKMKSKKRQKHGSTLKTFIFLKWAFADKSTDELDLPVKAHTEK